MTVGSFIGKKIPECINVCVATFGIVVPEAAGVTGNVEGPLGLFRREAKLRQPQVL